MGNALVWLRLVRWRFAILCSRTMPRPKLMDRNWQTKSYAKPRPLWSVPPPYTTSIFHQRHINVVVSNFIGYLIRRNLCSKNRKYISIGSLPQKKKKKNLKLAPPPKKKKKKKKKKK